MKIRRRRGRGKRGRIFLDAVRVHSLIFAMASKDIAHAIPALRLEPVQVIAGALRVGGGAGERSFRVRISFDCHGEGRA
jgi:hypothetical protein